ncbi:MAG TPA: glycosyltransferase [Candidatus Nanoarchaeia archaeon]|nr:glycosyltransferase [Candidatus Nanoarchaeia archaeon]
MNIGIVSVYFDRGSGVICQQIKQAIQWHVPNCNISILARMSVADNKKQIKYWDDYFHPNILLHHSYQISDEDFEQWIIANKLDIVIFVEEQHTKNLLPICNKLGIKSINYIVWEFINPAELAYYKQFTYLVCPTKSSYNLLKNDYMLDNAVYVQWGINLDQYSFQEPIKKDKPLLFFPAGWGGINNRKNEESVIKSFSACAPRDKMVLHIHSQIDGKEERGQSILKTKGNIPIQDLNKMYNESDIILLPSKHEGNGLPFMEASAFGRPVITVDAPPMNERIVNNINGLTCKVKEYKEISGIFVKSAEIDEWDFSEKIILLEDKDLLYPMQINSRKFAEENFNWYDNSKKLVDLLI